MTAKQRENHIKSITDKLVSMGWTIDRWGHYKKSVPNGKDYRVKMQKTSMRLEVKAGSQWVNILSDYFINIAVTHDGVAIKNKVIK